MSGLSAWKVSKYRVFSGPYLYVFSLNVGKYRPEKTPYLDTSQAVALQANKELGLTFCNSLNMTSHHVWVERFLQSRFYQNVPKEFRWPGNEWQLSKKLWNFIAKRHTFCSACLTYPLRCSLGLGWRGPRIKLFVNFNYFLKVNN